MSADLKVLVEEISSQAQSVIQAAHRLERTSDQAGQASGQISQTMLQVAQGAMQQAKGVTDSVAFIDRIKRGAEGITSGTQKQANSIGEMSKVVERLTEAISRILRKWIRLKPLPVTRISIAA
jgi:methyl-accepting chemotaxis protein